MDEIQPTTNWYLKATIVVFSVTLSTIVNDANASAFAIALPTIQKEMGMQQTNPQLQWIVSGYPLSCGCSLLLFGKFADTYGRKNTFLIGSLILVGTTLGCAFSSDVLTLNLFRGAQGIGSAAQMSASFGILADAFPHSRERRIAFATLSTGAAIGAEFGTAVSGALTEYTSKTWRSMCYLLACMSAISFAGGLVSINVDHLQVHDKRIDYLGSFLFTAGIVQVMYGLSQGGLAESKWATPHIIIILVSGISCVIGFLGWQYYLDRLHSTGCSGRSFFVTPPLLKPSFWTLANGRLLAMMVVAFFNWASFLGWMFWVQFYFQNYKHLSPLRTAVVLLPMFFSGVVCNVFVALMPTWVPPILILCIGTMATAIACFLFAISIPDASYWLYSFPAIILSSMGADIISCVGPLFIAKVVLPNEQGVAGALFLTMTQVGTAVGVTVTSVVSKAVTAGEGSDSVWAYRAAYWTAFSFGILASTVVVIAFRGVRLYESVS